MLMCHFQCFCWESVTCDSLMNANFTTWWCIIWKWLLLSTHVLSLLTLYVAIVTLVTRTVSLLLSGPMRACHADARVIIIDLIDSIHCVSGFDGLCGCPQKGCLHSGQIVFIVWIVHFISSNNNCYIINCWTSLNLHCCIASRFACNPFYCISWSLEHTYVFHCMYSSSNQ